MSRLACKATRRATSTSREIREGVRAQYARTGTSTAVVGDIGEQLGKYAEQTNKPRMKIGKRPFQTRLRTYIAVERRHIGCTRKKCSEARLRLLKPCPAFLIGYWRWQSAIAPTASAIRRI